MQSVTRLGRFAAFGIAALLIRGGAARADVTVSTVLTTVPVENAPKGFGGKNKIEAKPLDPMQLGDIVRVKTEADSLVGIARVTIEVDEQFRAELKQAPFTYDWDTLAEFDGAHTLAVTAYDNNGQTGVKRIKVKVENQLNLGLGVHVSRALEAFRKRDFIQLEKSARKAYKLSAANPEAARVMALSVGAKGDLGRAFQILDDQQVRIPKDDPVTEEARGFLLLSRAAVAPNLTVMLPDLKAGLAIAARQSDAALEAVKLASSEGQADYARVLARGDTFFMHRDYQTALDAYQRASGLASGVEAKRRAKHRIALAMLRIGRLSELELMLTHYANGPDGNATSSALLGAVLHQRQKYRAARDVVQSGVQSGNVAALMVAALSDLTLGAGARAYDEAKASVETADTLETQYVAQATLADTGDLEGARRSFRLAFRRDPMFLPALVEAAYDQMAYDKADDRFAQALGVLDVVLRYDPDNAAALAGKVAALLHLKRFKTSGPTLVRLTELDRTAPDVFILKAAQLDEYGTQQRAATELLAHARLLAPDYFKDITVPRMTEFVPRLIRWRRTVPITPLLLDYADKILPLPDKQG